MAKFKMAIIETLVEYVEVEADNEKEAVDKTWGMLSNGSLKLVEVNGNGVEYDLDVNEVQVCEGEF